MIVKQRRFSYWLVNGFERDYKLIDFEKSIITIVQSGTTDSRVVDISSVLALESAIKDVVYPEYVWFRKLVLIDNTNQHLIMIDRFDPRVYLFSKTLKKEIKGFGCTGIRLEHIDFQRTQ